VKKTTLSLFVIAASGVFGWNQLGAAPAEGLPGSALPTGDVQTGGIQRRVPDAVLAGARVPAQPVTFVMLESIGSRGAGEPTAYHATRVDATRAAMTIAASSSYPDGIYSGPVVDAYYGLIQIAAIIQGGQLVGIKVLKYPSDRRTSVFINQQALPLLQDEVISAQSANVDIISGATLTSEAFIRTLGAALMKAKS